MADFERKLKLTGDSTSAVNAVEKLNRSIDEGESAFTALRDNAIKSLNAIEDRAAKASRGGTPGGGNDRDIFKDDFGDASSGFSALSGAISGLAGSGAAAEAATLIADITGAVEYIPALSTSIAGIGLAAAPVLAVTAGVGLALAELSRRQEEFAAASQKAADAIEREARLKLETEDLVRKGDLEGIKARQEAAAAELELQQAILDGAFAKKAEAEAQLGVNGSIEKALQSGQLAWDDYLNKIKEAEAALAGANQIIEKTVPELEKASDEFDKISKSVPTDALITLNAVGMTVEEIAAEEKRLTSERERAAAVISDLAQQEADLVAANSKRLAQQEADRNRAAGRTEEDLTIRRTRAQEDLNRALELGERVHSQRLIDIANTGNKALEDANKQYEERRVDIQSRRAELEASLLTQTADIETKYQKQALKEATDFAEKRRKIERDYQDKLDEAELNTDVSAFIQLKKDQERALEDLDRDEKKSKQSRKEQLEEERSKVQSNHDDRLKQLDDELAKAQQQTTARIAEIQTQTQAAIDSERLTYAERLRIDADTRTINQRREEEDRALRQRRQDEDYRIQDARARESHNAALVRLDERQRKEQALASEINTSLDNLNVKAQMLAAATTPRQMTTQPTSVSPAIGLVQNTMSTLASGFPSLPGPQTSAPQVSVNFAGANFGAIATPQDLDALGVALGDLLQLAFERVRRP